jgi:hydroxyacylglutathione hydrolase
VADADAPIVLLLDEDRVEEAVRDLVRVGLDNVQGYATFDDVEAHFAAGGAPASIEEITMADLESRRMAGARVLDVRYGPEFDEHHVPSAIHIPYTRLAERIDEVPSDGPVVVHCQTGVRSAAAAAFLARAGYQVAYVNGRFDRWQPKEEGPAIERLSDRA